MQGLCAVLHNNVPEPRLPESWRSAMPKVIAREGEDFETLLERFNAVVSKTHCRRWYKRRFGYHEKPSLLNKKRRRHIKANGGKGVWLRIGLAALHRRNGPDDAMGH